MSNGIELKIILETGEIFNFFVKGMMKKLLGSTEMKSGLLFKMKRKERERKK